MKYINYSLRPATLEDFDFIYDLKKENFKLYVDKICGWEDSYQKERLEHDLKEHIQHKKIIMYENIKIGIYVVHITENGDMFINEISLKREYQNKGIGTNLLKKQLEENKYNEIRTILQVFKDNPAKKLYERLGFSIYNETETHYQMEVKR